MSTYDQEFDDRAPAKGGFPIWLILVLGGVVVGVVLFCGLSAAAYLVYQRNLARQEAMAMEQEVQFAEREQADTEEKREEMRNQEIGRLRDWLKSARFTREEFRRKVEGKSGTEALDAVGYPDQVNDVSGGSRWRYSGRTYESDPSNLDRQAIVLVRDGQVVSVQFE